MFIGWQWIDKRTTIPYRLKCFQLPIKESKMLDLVIDVIDFIVETMITIVMVAAPITIMGLVMVSNFMLTN